VVLVGEELRDGSRSEFYQVYLSEWQLTNLNDGYVLPLDFNAYLALKRDISKAVFGHLSVWFYASRGQAIEKNYTDLCQLLNIRAYPHVSKAASVLAPSLDELLVIGYLSKWDLSRRCRGADLKLTLLPGKRLLSLPHFAAVADSDLSTSTACLPQWVSELTQRGVAERKARQLALDTPDTQPVLDQIEYADQLIHQDRCGRGKIANPAGFIIWAIESNLSVPSHFETSRKRTLRAGTEHAAQTERLETLELMAEYDRECELEVRQYIATRYPGELLDTALHEEIKRIRRAQPAWFDRVPNETKREVGLARLEAAAREFLSLPTFEQWRSKQLQRPLFSRDRQRS